MRRIVMTLAALAALSACVPQRSPDTLRSCMVYNERLLSLAQVYDQLTPEQIAAITGTIEPAKAICGVEMVATADATAAVNKQVGVLETILVSVIDGSSDNSNPK